MTPHNIFRALLLVASLLTTSLAQNRKTVADYIPAVANNGNHTPTRWKTSIGGQNFTWCCIQAVAESLAVNATGQLVAADDPPIVGLDVDELQRATDEGQFPCTARYESDVPGGAPEISVPYTWLAQTCPGWQLSSGDNLNGWLQPLSGFLLPAVIFCLSVPRRRKLHVFRAFFVADLAGVKSYIPALLGAIGAMILVTIDTIIWLSVCWALSGPMILSGLYEALLDNRVIDFVQEKKKHRNLTLDMRCRLLMLVLIGNLDLALEDDPFANDPAYSRRQSQRHQVIEGTSPPPDRPRSGTLDSDTRHQLLTFGGKRSSGETARLGSPSEFGIQLESVSSNMNSEGEVGEIRQRPMSLHTDYLGVHAGDSTTRVNSSMDQVSSHPDHRENVQRRTPDIRVERANAEPRRMPTGNLRASPWRHMEELLYPIRLYDDEDTKRNLSPRQYPRRWHRHMVCHNSACTDPNHFETEAPRPRTPKIDRQIRKTKTRLRTMLNCQYSFGSMVGAPVVFFLGGFIFALLQSIQSIGDEDTALALAFGQWYMTIPHIAIISGLLLAGNNPNILEGVFATQRHEVAEDDLKILGLNFGLAYPSCYKVAWQWHRGHNKLRWIHTLLESYGLNSEVDQAYGVRDEQKENLLDLEELRNETTLLPLDWALILIMAAFLLGIPFALAFITAFYTPEVGLSCRSFTFTIYACAELGQVLLWLWAYAGPPGTTRQRGHMPQRSSGPLGFLRSGGWLHHNGFYNPKYIDHFLPPGEPRTPRAVWRALRSEAFRDVRSVWCCLWYALYVFFGTIATLSALGGTLMQLLGVYTADICYLTVDKWMHPYEPGITAMISSNSRVMIRDAQTYWKPCAITAIAFMTFVSFVGWWYQRRMKDVFTTLVSEVDLEEHDRRDTRDSRSHGLALGG
ncbi:hypothetical protein VSDG_04879 [Cytospora chrysosperma]|uniref:Uncharacterized protein n=1 Tax=Cytospora chrysosperma TaxID=252740 RepID=A0A423W3R5_CYTCH|nr:hypothetical protein VSDG_04879 [Valsa sordida]